MADREPITPNRFLRVKNTYTFSEAIELMKLRDRYVTTNTIRWVDARTNQPVSIGYNS